MNRWKSVLLALIQIENHSLFSMGNRYSRIYGLEILYRDNKIVESSNNHYGVYIGEEGVIDFLQRRGEVLSSLLGDLHAGQYE